MIDKKIILASKSPRRSQLLSEAGIEFEIRTSEVEESFPDELPVREVASYLAQKKAQASFHLIEEGEILLAADSVVILGDTIFNKPQSEEEAFRFLSALSGKVHEVMTGVCLLSHQKERLFAGSTKVHFHDLSPQEINYYIKNFQPYDKAGAYAIQEWIGYCKVYRIEGTYSNIMGLPVDLVYDELSQF
ncbi:MAG: Maf family protein [Bacteroidota bacterium]